VADYATLDESTRQIINDRADSALNLSGNYDEDIAQGKLPGLTKPAETNYNRLGLDSAIANKYSKIASDEVGRIQKLNRLNAPAAGMRKILSAADLADKQYRFDLQQEMAAKQRRMAEESQRAQLVGSLLGVGGMIAGYGLAGPAGGMVGGAVGNAAGNMGRNGGGQGRMP